MIIAWVAIALALAFLIWLSMALSDALFGGA